MSEQRRDSELQRAWQKNHAAASAGDCLTEEQLTRLVLKQAATSEREAAADHLARCTACAQDYRMLRALRPWAHERGEQLDPDAAATPAPAQISHSPWRFVWSGSLAAAALVSVVIGTTVWVNRETSTPEIDRVETTATVAPSAAPIRQTPAATLSFEKPPLKLTAAVALQWRGASEEASVERDDLTRAFDAYRRDDFRDAATRFEAVARRAPRLAEAQFYLGISKLFLHDPAAAIDPLRQARTLAPDLFGPDVAWYLSVAYAGVGDRERAFGELRPVCAGGKDYSTAACAAIQKLSDSQSP